mmetsp:Transcript_27197/g.50951  ORF Transcript_27197/g.50951 Transcript_27197/m.50951 type:complete len:246 (+) Transcript_27197:134-871(+)
MEVSFSAVKVRSTTDTSGVGTRNAMPVSLPLVLGRTSPTALAAPVADGIMLQAAARPPRQSLAETPSTVFWVAVYAWMVVMRPFSIPMPSFRSTWQIGARQLVVQEALDTTWWVALSYSVWFTPHTKVFREPLPGAEMMTFSAPASMCPRAFSYSTKRPVDSMTYLTSRSFHGKALGPSRLAIMHLILWPFTMSSSFSPIFTSCLNLPWTVSYFIWYAKYSASVDISTTPTTSSLVPKSPWSQMA